MQVHLCKIKFTKDNIYRKCNYIQDKVKHSRDYYQF